MVNLLPDRMQMYFNRGAYVNELSTVGGLFKNRFLVNQQDKSMLHQLKVFKKKIETGYDENEVEKQLQALPQLTIIETQSTDTIAGLVCKKAIGVFDNISLPEMEIWYTQEINLDNPNWCTQFHGLNGVLMQYEVEQLGIRMRFRAISVQNLESVEEQLEPEPGYESVSVDELKIELEQLVSTFNF
jgi:GLPGLI family protein